MSDWQKKFWYDLIVSIVLSFLIAFTIIYFILGKINL